MLTGDPLHTPVEETYLIEGVPAKVSSPFPNALSHSCLCSLDITSRPGDTEKAGLVKATHQSGEPWLGEAWPAACILICKISVWWDTGELCQHYWPIKPLGTVKAHLVLGRQSGTIQDHFAPVLGAGLFGSLGAIHDLAYMIRQHRAEHSDLLIPAWELTVDILLVLLIFELSIFKSLFRIAVCLDITTLILAHTGLTPQNVSSNLYKRFLSWWLG